MLKKILMVAATMSVGAFGTAANAVPFEITGGGYSLGSGFGCPTTGQNAFLCVAASSTLATPSIFNLVNAGDSTLLTFGTFTLQDDNNSLSAGEQDNLDVTAFLTFTNPIMGNVQQISVTGTTTGVFADADIDLSISFAPVVLNFGTGGQFTVLFDSMFFGANPQTVTQNVRITLDNPGNTDVPEPAMIGLLGLGVLGVGVARRRKAVTAA